MGRYSGMVADWIWVKLKVMAANPASTLDETMTGTTVRGFPTLSFRMDPSDVAINDVPGTDPLDCFHALYLKQGCLDAGVDIRFKSPGFGWCGKIQQRRVTAVAGEKGLTRNMSAKGIVMCWRLCADQEMREYYIPSTRHHANMFEMVNGPKYR